MQSSTKPRTAELHMTAEELDTLLAWTAGATSCARPCRVDPIKLNRISRIRTKITNARNGKN